MNYQERIERLRARKEAQTMQKLAKNGYMDEDDYGSVLPPENIQIPIEFNDPVHKTFYGAKLWGKNFRALMERHPVYVDPDDALAGRWMYILQRLRPFESATSPKNMEMAPVFNYDWLKPLHEKYGIMPGIGKMHHFAGDYHIGLELGWGGLLKKVRKYAAVYPEKEEFYRHTWQNSGINFVPDGEGGWEEYQFQPQKQLFLQNPYPGALQGIDFFIISGKSEIFFLQSAQYRIQRGLRYHDGLFHGLGDLISISISPCQYRQSTRIEQAGFNFKSHSVLLVFISFIDFIAMDSSPQHHLNAVPGSMPFVIQYYTLYNIICQHLSVIYLSHQPHWSRTASCKKDFLNGTTIWRLFSESPFLVFVYSFLKIFHLIAELFPAF